ncbi:MFS transporter [Thalassoglobus polymorphus]|uniref:Nucleoside transporter YegT n=1 Tax=Thalassoglobus polymorphus TaxID=2527994 RepID=A0A517QNY3_9PLAN|nr:MFS transporter [Thalassoglobus polymorphus]QDT33360.1 Putative nucleoside transporter YegT [Thalassoglobus polymorphus]
MNDNTNTGGGMVGMTPRLSLMMFLQFFTWGAWFATLSAVLDSNGLSAFKGGAYESVPIAAIFAPLFLGLVADRLFASEKVMGALLVIGGLVMAVIPQVAAASGSDAGNTIVWLILIHSLCFMPTLGLGNTIAFTHIPTQNDFPKIRVWGTIGWIVAGLIGGGLGWSNSFNLFWMGASSSILLGVFCFFLPNTPPPLKGKPVDLRSLLMVDAFKLLADFNFAIFALCSTLICIPLAYYYGLTSTYLNQTGFAQSAATMTLGQMSEIFFMLLIPFFFRRFGLKNMILIGMASWVLRYALFAFGAPNQVTWMLLLAVLIHGICYDFFFVTGFMYTDDKAPKDVRGQAQGLLVFLTQGIGMFFGFRIAFGGSFGPIPLNWHIGEMGKQVVSSEKYNEALITARGADEGMSFFESFSQMFSRSLPEGLDPQLLSTTMTEWKQFWFFPAIMAGVVFVVFALFFHDKMSDKDVSESEVAEAAPSETVV